MILVLIFFFFFLQIIAIDKIRMFLVLLFEWQGNAVLDISQLTNGMLSLL